MPLITILFLSHFPIMHFTFVVSLNYILTCVLYVKLCNSACRETKQPHLFGLFCVPSCDLACRGTARTPLTLSVLRMWMRNHCRTITHILIRPCWSCCPCARCFETGQTVAQNWTFYRMDGSVYCRLFISYPLVAGIGNSVHLIVTRHIIGIQRFSVK